MPKKFSLFIASVVFFSFFVFFSKAVHKQVFRQFDFNTTVKVQDHVSVASDDIFSAFSLIGSFEIATVILLVVLFIRSVSGKKWRGLVSFGFALFLYFSIHLFEIYGKLFVKQHPPPFMFHRYALKFLFPSSYVQPGYSYPSGHAARTMFISTILFFMIVKSKKLSPAKKAAFLLLVGAFDFIMFTSRVYLGEHWTTDVMGGALLGLSLAVIGSI